jgi:hypothetical protein
MFRLTSWSTYPPTFRAICEHTFNCALSMLSFMTLSALAHLGLEKGVTLTIFEHVENIVLVVITFYFAGILLYDLTEERVRALINFIVRLCSRQAVFA